MFTVTYVTRIDRKPAVIDCNLVELLNLLRDRNYHVENVFVYHDLVAHYSMTYAKFYIYISVPVLACLSDDDRYSLTDGLIEYSKLHGVKYRLWKDWGIKL